MIAAALSPVHPSAGGKSTRHLACVAAVALMIGSAPAFAQDVAPAASPSPSPPDLPAAPAPLPETREDPLVEAIDPDAPLAPMDDLGVDWPDLATPLAPLPPFPPPVVADGAATQADAFADEVIAADADLPPPVGRSPVAGDSVSVGGAVGDEPANVAIAEALNYDVMLEGFGDIASSRFRARFDGLSVLRARDDDPANGAQLNRRIADDTLLLDRMLRNEGYYDATLISDVRRNADNLTVAFSVQPGPRYSYSAVELIGLAAAGPDEVARLSPYFDVAAGEPIMADDLVKAQATLETELRETGYPFGDVGEERITIDHDLRSGRLEQPVTPGARLRFGTIIAEDGGLLGAPHIQRIARFEPGEWYRQSDVDDLRRALIATGLVASVDIDPRAAADGSSVDLGVAIAPAPPRTIAGAIGYGTGEGFRAEASWEHRNLFPPEGALIVRGVAGTQEQLASVSFRRNNFRRRDNVLTLQLLASNLNRDAYDARTALVSARLEQTTTLIFQKRWAWSIGAELIASDERSFSQTVSIRETYFIGALPGVLSYDRSNDLLDPTRGYRLSARVSPEVSFRGSAFGYVRAQVDGSAYFPASSRLVLAGRVRIGSIVGSGSEGIAPSRRYYAGGGGSVRGYGYQNIGPRDLLDNPVGGKSLFEVAAETRVRFGNFAVVPFVDAGNVYDGSLPDFSGLRVGAGVGVRYHTNFGPLRVDVGTPLNPRRGDSRIGVYVSLGQAF